LKGPTQFKLMHSLAFNKSQVAEKNTSPHGHLRIPINTNTHKLFKRQTNEQFGFHRFPTVFNVTHFNHFHIVPMWKYVLTGPSNSHSCRIRFPSDYHCWEVFLSHTAIVVMLVAT